jgi:hypothetical protein
MVVMLSTPVLMPTLDRTACRETIGREYDRCRTSLRQLRRDANKIGRTTAQARRACFAVRPTRDSRTDAALATAVSFFRFASVARKPRFSHDPVNLAPDCDG